MGRHPNPEHWSDPWPAGVSGAAPGLVFECPPCRIHRTWDRRCDYTPNTFMALYNGLKDEAWEHNLRVHIRPQLPKRPPARPAPIPAGGVQLDIFGELPAP